METIAYTKHTVCVRVKWTLSFVFRLQKYGNGFNPPRLILFLNR